MYKLKSEIIEEIQHYHEQVYELYLGLYCKMKDPKMINLLEKLCRQEKWRKGYLEKHKNIAKAIDCWLAYPPNTISNQISDCLKDVNIKSNLTLNDIAEIEFHFDNCLIKLYQALSIEENKNCNILNIFHYMINKIKQEDIELQQTVADLIL